MPFPIVLEANHIIKDSQVRRCARHHTTRQLLVQMVFAYECKFQSWVQGAYSQTGVITMIIAVVVHSVLQFSYKCLLGWMGDWLVC